MVKGQLYQHNTLGALMGGLYDGTTTIQELLEHGDTGIGTLDALDGELMILQGKAYQTASTGQVIELTGNEKIPYAAITDFKSERVDVINEQRYTAAEFSSLMSEKLLSAHTFAAIKITGEFEFIKTRAVPKQEKPYPRLVEVSRNQPEFMAKNITGTIVGFYTPELFQGASAAGYHLHFLSDDKTMGGHVLDYVLTSGSLEIQTMTDLVLHFPTEDETFMKSQMSLTDLQAEIEEAES